RRVSTSWRVLRRVAARPSSGAASASPHGTKDRTGDLGLRSSRRGTRGKSGTSGLSGAGILIPLIWIPFSCSGASQDQESLQSTDDDYEYEYDSEYEYEEESGDAAFPHPKRATAWHTRTLVNTTPQPTPDQIQSCT